MANHHEKNLFEKQILKIRHKFSSHILNPKTEILIIGTFNPDTAANKADFFYGRPQNHLWRLLPHALDKQSLKRAKLTDKLAFMKKYKIDFADLIAEIEVNEGEETIYDDNFIDDKVTKWRDIQTELSQLKALKAVCFTRKTFTAIPQIKKQVEKIRRYCQLNNICFNPLITPSRTCTQAKQNEWTACFNEIRKSL